MPPGKTVGGRERNQLETGVHEFPWLKMNLGTSAYEVGLEWSGLLYQIKPGLGQTASSPFQNDLGLRHNHCHSVPRQRHLQLHFQGRKYGTEKEASILGEWRTLLQFSQPQIRRKNHDFFFFQQQNNVAVKLQLQCLHLQLD